MRRLLAAWVLAVLAAGCGTEDKKPAGSPKAEPIPMFEKKAPKGKKGSEAG